MKQMHLFVQKRRLIYLLLFVLNVLLTFNTFVLPFDKLVLPIYIFLLLCLSEGKTTRNSLIIGISLLSFVLLVILLHIFSFSLLILYPILFYIAAYLSYTSKYVTLSLIKRALLVNILIGGFFCIAANLGFNNPYSLSLIEKGIPFLYAPQGFSPTLQVYSTCCISWLIIDLNENNKGSLLTIIVLLCALATLNRVCIIFIFIILFYYKRRLFLFLFLSIFVAFIYFLDFFLETFLTTSTLNSRDELRVGAQLSYWESNDILVYLFGRANHQTSDAIANKTVWERAYIENGLDFIVHSYGILGLFCYLILTLCFIAYLLKNKLYSLATFAAYYFFFVQIMTNEYLTSSIYFFILILCQIAKEDIDKLDNNYDKKSLFFSAIV